MHSLASLCNGSELIGLQEWASLNQFSSLSDLHHPQDQNQNHHQQQHLMESLLLPNDPNLVSSSSENMHSGSSEISDNYTTFSSLLGNANSTFTNNNGSSSGGNFAASMASPNPFANFSINCSDPETILQAFNFTPPFYEDPVYFSHSYRVVGTFFQGLIFLIGVLGNILVVFVVARNKSMHSPTNCYLVSLAIADCIVLIAAIPQEIVSYYLVGSRWIWGDVGCALLIFLQNLGINASSLSLAAFTVERYIAICKPFLAQTVCTVNRAKKIIAGVWIFAFIYCFPWLFLTSTFPIFYKGYSNIQTCEHKLSREQYLGYYFADLIVFYVIPLLLSVVLYSQIARILYKSQSSKSTNVGGGGSGAVGSCAAGSSGNGNLTTDLSKPNAARVQVVKMLVMVVVIFGTLWLPYRGMLVYNSLAKEKFMDLWYLMLCKTCVYINSAINPILYNAMSVKFRRAFGRTLSCGKNRDSYDRWPYCRSQPTYTTVSTALPSTSTLTLVTPPMKSPRRLNTPRTYCNAQSILTSTPNKSTITSFEVIVDTCDDIRSCSEEIEITQL